jgi:hypothetical protein
MGNRGGDSAGGASTLKDKAPEWMKEALERWEREDS